MATLSDYLESDAKPVDILRNDIGLFLNLIKERKYHLDLVRELLSNAGEKEVGATEIHISYTKDRDGHVFEIDDDVYGCDFDTVAEESAKDFLTLLHTMQNYNYRYRPNACAALFSLFEETVSPMERNSEGMMLWLALKDLHGLRDGTLWELLLRLRKSGESH